MRYQKIVSGKFLSRPNRFIAIVDVDGKKETCHVKNTGRCKELFTEGAKVILQVSDNPERKTKFDVIAVYKNNILINIDSQVPNAVVAESIADLGLIKNIRNVRREVIFGDSRIDIFVEADKNTFVEVKGVTLEKDGIVLFPDAPTERGVKHINELIKAKENGYGAIIFFLIQMKDVKHFSPNYEMHPEFGEALKNAKKNGVKIVAYDCFVEEDSIAIGEKVKVIL